MLDTAQTNSAGGKTIWSTIRLGLYILAVCVLITMIDNAYPRAALGLADEQRDRIESRRVCDEKSKKSAAAYARSCTDMWNRTAEWCRNAGEILYCDKYDFIITEVNDRLIPDWKVVYVERFYPLEDISPEVEEAYQNGTK